MTFMGCDIDFKRFKQENLYKFISQKNKYNEFIKNEIEHSLYFTNEKMVTKTTVSFVVNGITYRLNVQRVPYYNNLLDETLSNIESLEITGPSEIISEAGALYSVINNSDSRFKVKNIKYTEGYNSSKQKRK
jgi:hypothetical protein